MTTIIRCGVAVVGLFVATAAIAAENAAAGPKNALDSLLTQLNTVNQDRDMMTAKKALVAAEAMEKFNQQCRGKPLVVRLKIQDVAPNDQGQCLTANRPDLEGVQFTGKFQSNLSNAEVMSVTKDSVLAVTGMVRAANRPPTHFRSSDVFRPGSNITFSLRANPSCQICLDNVSYRIEAESKTTPDVRSASSHGGSSSVSSHGGSAFVSSYGGSAPADKTKTEQTHGVDEIKLFFLKGILQSQHQSGSTAAPAPANTGTRQYPGWNTRPTPTPDPAKVKHNRIYTAADLIAKFGNPSSRNSKATAEEWIYKCKDGVVHVHFTEVGYSHSASTSRTETLKLEINSVDSSSLPSTGGSRY